MRKEVPIPMPTHKMSSKESFKEIDTFEDMVITVNKKPNSLICVGTYLLTTGR